VEPNLGAVPVLARRELLGMFSERDRMSPFVVEGRDPAGTGDILLRDLDEKDNEKRRMRACLCSTREPMRRPRSTLSRKVTLLRLPK
jgi:hypothetical protein